MDKNGEELKIEQIAEILKVSKEEIALALEMRRSICRNCFVGMI